MNQGGTLDYAQPNVTGGGSSTSAPNLVINQGTVTNTAVGNAHNYFGSQLTLNGGTLTGTGAGTSAAPQWNFVFGITTGTVSVGTATPSLITGTGVEGGLALTNTTTFYITGAGGLTVAVPLQNGNAGANPSTLIETGGGVLNLTASNAYSGGTIINGGTLELGNLNALQSGVVTNNAAVGGLALTPGWIANLGGLSGSGNIALTDLGGNTVSLNVNGNSGVFTTYSGVLSGSGGLNNAGGTLVLTNSNSLYGGPTTITGGALVLGNVGVLSPLWSTSGNLSVPAGATFGVEVGSNPGEFSVGNVGTVLGNVGFAASANLGIQVIAPETVAYNSVIANTASGALVW